MSTLVVARRRQHVDVITVMLLAAGLALLTSVAPTYARAVAGIASLGLLTAVAFEDRRLALIGSLAWLTMLGVVRRFLIPFVGYSQEDPLLLVSPLVAVVLLLVARGLTPRFSTVLSSLALFQTLWVIVSIANPNETSIVTAAQGAVFFLVPLLWFFVGRTLTGGEHDLVLRTVWWMSVPVLVLGFWHTFVGLLPFELTWLGVADVPPSLIFVRGFNVRPFSTLTSPQEYGVVCGIFAVIAVAWTLHHQRHRGLVLSFVGIVMVASFLQGSRGTFLALLVAVMVTVALRLRSAGVVLLAISALAAAAFFAAALGLDVEVDRQTAEEQERASTVVALIRHQLEGLGDPSDTTLGLHLELFGKGFLDGLNNPLGFGPSRYQFATRSEFRGDASLISPENQLSITASALGLPAVVALAGIYVTAYVTAFRLYRRAPTWRHLAWFGLLVVVGDQALNGRLYFTSTVIALVLGGIAAEWGVLRSAVEKIEQPPVTRSLVASRD